MVGTWIRRGTALCLALCMVLLAHGAFAAGSVKWKQTKLKEDTESGSWRLEVTISFSKAPDVAHLPVKFEFQQTMYYERNLVDGKDGPQLRRVPMRDKQAQIESVTIGFLDPARGTIQKRTRFSFKVTRGHGYEAGEYKVTLRNGTTGRVIGRSAKLTFDGENPVIDRRAISFVSEEDKKKKTQMKQVDKDGNVKDGEGKDSADPDAADMDVADPGVGKEGWDPVYGAPATEPASEEPSGPPPIKEKPGGCGCHVPGTSNSSPAWLLVPVGLLWFARRRRHGAPISCR